MTPEAQRIAIAQACGWTDIHISEFDRGVWGTMKQTRTHVPNYLSDLNAMHEEENILNNNEAYHYELNLADVVDARVKKTPNLMLIETDMIHASAAQRAEAFLRALNLWSDEVE